MTDNNTRRNEAGSGSQPFEILLVEDNLADASLITTLLREKNPDIRVTLVRDGEEALSNLARRSSPETPLPDAIILDLNLPRLSGFEVLAMIRNDAAWKSIPAYMLTTSATREDRERALGMGVTDFLTKPGDLTEMEALIERLANQEFPKLRAQKNRLEVTTEAFRSFVDSAQDYAIFMLSPQGYIQSWNAGAQRIKGYVADEVLGRHFSIFYTPEDLERDHPRNELEIAEREGRYQEEGWRIRKEGTRFWASVTITAARDASGKLIGFGKVTSDMTNRRKDEQRLRESEERFRILVEGVRDYAIFMLEPNGNIASWNKGAERINGYQSQEIIGRHFSALYTEQAKRNRHPEHELEIARAQGRYEEEGIRVRKDGSTFWASVVITALYDEQGKLRGFAKVTRDITDRKRSEEQIRKWNMELEHRVTQRTKELEASMKMLREQQIELMRSNADLKQFAYVASHDLQEPLRSAVTYLQLLRRRIEPLLNDETRQLLQFVEADSQRMRSLVQDLLAYATIDRGIAIDRAHHLAEAVKLALINLRAHIEEVGATVTVRELPVVPADIGLLTQVFQNLIANALTYRSPERPARIEIGAAELPQEWRIEVRDNGLGINAEYYEKIFVIFQRLHSDRYQYPGTGIGLAICKKIIERHGGRIWVESEVDKGSTFAFSLPKNLAVG